MLYYLIITLYVLICLLLVVTILLQQGKGGDIANAFGGGSSQAVFGARSGATLLTRATSVLAALFVIGAAAQVIGALMNKISNWYVYYSCLDDEFTSTRKYRLAEWLIDQFWIDILLDVVTILAFGAAIWFMMTVFG